jgi:hypothetical protein
MHRIFRSLSSSQLAIATILLCGLLAITARDAGDPDLYWHLRTGQWIIESGHVPHSDPFSFTRAGHAWISHEWLSELAFYELWKHGGAAALIIFSAIVTTAGFMLLFFRCSGKRYWAAAATAFGALASSPCWGVRPQMFTFTMASLLLWLIDRGEKRPKLLLCIPPLFLLWLNLHGGFALGPALLLAYGLGLLWEMLAGDTMWHEVRASLIHLGLLLVLCLALVPLNPSGARLYHYPFDTLSSVGMRSFIGEWFSPDFHQRLYRPFLLVWLLVLAALATSRVRPKGRVIVPLLLTGFASLDAVRHIPIFILVAMPMIAATLPVASPSFRDSSLRPASSPFRTLFNTVVVILIATFAFVRWVVVVRNESNRETELYPRDAVASLQNGKGRQQRLFVYYDWGGYAIWRLYPDYRVFLDGRADLYGDDLLRQFKTAIRLSHGWRNVLDSWNVETVLVPPSSALAQALLIDREWQAVFQDSQAVIFERRPGGAENTQIYKDDKDKVAADSHGQEQKSEKMFPR